ncbi:hypothetical protein RRG08_040754 [Elysia crispata]|uniref:Uncharacterized protein n=1 Tax=Elysia crispata TaxID=231223 RepID=A0AAE1BDP4_9GAST|nr:hypothetical protein RRG08_040754 [Elysia crispata]
MCSPTSVSLSCARMECEEYRGDSEVEPDSDHDDGDGYICGGAGGGGSHGGWLGHPLHNFHTTQPPVLWMFNLSFASPVWEVRSSLLNDDFPIMVVGSTHRLM